VTAITDGTSNTILFGESSNFDPNWPQYAPIFGSPANYPMSLITASWPIVFASTLGGTGSYPLNTPLPSSPPTDVLTALSAVLTRSATYGSGHTQGANFVFCDGSVRFLSNAINSAAVIQPSGSTLLQALSTRAGGEVIDGSQY
jgi:prepilin-type processing-associated H-X9-DG protein